MSDHAHLKPHNFNTWIAIPDSPMEAKINRDNPYPSIRLRWNPETAKQWFKEVLKEMLEEVATNDAASSGKLGP